MRTILLSLAMLSLVATVAFLQISKHRTPRPIFADEQSEFLNDGLAESVTIDLSDSTHAISLNASETPVSP
jgi:hypothetical protein